jgi:hypothetical protein
MTYDNDGEIINGMEQFPPMHPCGICGEDCDCLDGQDDGICEGCPECQGEPKGDPDEG